MFKAGLDATGVERGAAQAAEKAKKAFSSMSSEVSGRIAGMFTASRIIDGVTNFAKAIISTADDIGDMADNLNLSTDEVQKLEIAAGRAGFKFTKMVSAVQAVQQKITEAQTGDEKAKGIFSRLGIDPSKGSALDVMRSAVNEAAKGGDKLAAAQDIFGKKLTGVVNSVKQLEALGPIKIFEEKDLEKLGQSVDKLREASNEVKATAAPLLTTIIDGLTSVLKTGPSAIGKSVLSGGLFSGDLAGKLGQQYADFLKNPNDMSSPSLFPQKGGKDSTTSVAKAAAIPLAFQSDALSRIGLFVGGRGDSGNQLVTIGNYQLSELRAIRAELQHQNR